MSFSLTDLPPRKVCRLILTIRTPWRRRLVVTTVSDAARDSPRTCRLLRSMPSQRNVYSLTSRRDCAVAVAMIVLACRASPSLVGDRLDFLERRDAGLDLQQSGLAQVPHTFLLRLFRNIQRIAGAHDDLAQVVGDRHHLVDADTSLVSRALAQVLSLIHISEPT